MTRSTRKGDEQYDHLVKLLLLGDSAVGKSSLLMRFCEDKFTPQFVLTIGVDFKTKTVACGGKRLKLQVWDTAGQERFRTITPAYYRSAMGVILTYDITSMETFNNIRYWMKNLEDYADKNVQKVLIGNKCDLEGDRQVPTQRGRDLAAEYHIPFFETSAKSNSNVEASFMCISDLIRASRFPDDGEMAGGGSHGIRVTQQPDQQQKKKCCG
ncbi:unnamed protein product [Vitrella brassicaformis CCMP3155]|uniref:Ras-related protein Rab-8A n=2 Tax=Vitrella brassicaformis TaxID=1169539 RepID=A0A0G4FHD0_VITBC|nr:unnamed protein product [Vitrella brassicaformis CCMP3155]|eukprot:CEM12832.1 unnamed protein product [Vitrella brassicaformis CCMP3155]